MAENTLDVKSLGIQTREVSSVDTFDLFDDIVKEKETSDLPPVDGPPKKKDPVKTPIKQEEEVIPDDAEEVGLDLLDDDEEEEVKDIPKPPKKEEKKEVPKEEEEPKQESDEQVFQTLTKELLRMGIFTADEEGEDPEIESAQDFAERWEYEAVKRATARIESYIQSKGQEKLEWFDAIYNKGVSPREYMEQFIELDDLANLDLEIESNQEKVVRELLRSQGFESEDIDAEVAKLINLGEIEASSQRYHKVLLKRKAAALQEITNQKQEEDRKKAFVRDAYRTKLTQVLNLRLKDKEFDGIPVTPQVAKDVFDSLYNYRYTLPNGDPITQFDKDIRDLDADPEMKIKVGLLINMLKKDPTLSTIKKKAITKETNELFSELGQKKKSLVKKQPVEKTSEYW